MNTHTAPKEILNSAAARFPSFTDEQLKDPETRRLLVWEWTPKLGRTSAECLVEMYRKRAAGEALLSTEQHFFDSAEKMLAAVYAAEEAEAAAISQRTHLETVRANVEILRLELGKYEVLLSGHKSFINSATADGFLGWARRGMHGDANLDSKSIEYGASLCGARASIELLENQVVPTLKERLAAAEKELAEVESTLTSV